MTTPVTQVHPGFVYVTTPATTALPNSQQAAPYLLDQSQINRSIRIPSITQGYKAIPSSEAIQISSVDLGLESTTAQNHLFSNLPMQSNLTLLPSEHGFPSSLSTNMCSVPENESKTFDKQEPFLEEKGSISRVKEEPSQQNENIVDRLKNLIDEVDDISLIWEVSRDLIFSKYRLWDLIIDMAAHTHSKDSNDKTNNLTKFQIVIRKLEELLGEFKCFMDACAEHNEALEDSFCLGPELSRAFDMPPNKSWHLKDITSIDSLYKPFFEDPESNILDELEIPFMDFEDEGDEDTNDDNQLMPSNQVEVELQTFEDTKPFICSKCGNSYKRKSSWSQHEKKCVMSSEIEDKRSNQRTPSENCKWIVNKKNGLLACVFKDCQHEDLFQDELEVWKHFQDEHAMPEDFLFSCSICRSSFVHPEILNEHLADHSRSNTPEFTGEDQSYSCNLCSFTTSAMGGLTLHRRRVHKLDKNNTILDVEDNPDYQSRDPQYFKHQCMKCTRRYKKAHHLERHSLRCDGVPPPRSKPIWIKNEAGRYICGVQDCQSDKSWTNSFSVWHHFNSEHANMQDETYCVWKCDICQEGFPNKSMLTKHRNHTHEELFRFQCPKCDKRLPSNKSFKYHMHQHSNIKPYSCDLCDYKAITQGTVKQHMMRMHAESMPDKVLPKHVCDICGKSFKVSKYYLIPTKTNYYIII